MKLRWSAHALADLNRFAAFLRDRHPRMAKRIGPELLKRADMIADYPDLGRLIDVEGYRELSQSVLNAVYVFRYRCDEDGPVMLRVFHGREQRNP